MGESEGCPRCISGAETHWVGVRNLTRLGKPLGQGPTSPAPARLCVEGQLCSSQICACNLHWCLARGLQQAPRQPSPGSPRVTAKKAWPKATNECDANRLSLSKASRAGVDLEGFNIVNLQIPEGHDNDLAQPLGSKSRRGDAQGHMAS